MAQRCRQHVTVIVVVAHATKEGNQLGIILIAAHHDFTLFLGILARTQIVGGQAIVGEVLVLGIETGILGILVGITRHTLDIMQAELAGIVSQPLENILAFLAVGTTGLTLAAIVDGDGACRRTEPAVVVTVLVVGKHYLS